MATVRAAQIQALVPDRAATWAARVQAVQRQRTLAAQGKKSDLLTSMAAQPISGSKVGLMILVQFPDDVATTAADAVNFPTTQAKMDRYANAVGYVDDGNTGSIRDYYFDQSAGQLTFTHLVTPLITLPHPRSYYNFSDYPNNATLAYRGIVGKLLLTDAINKLLATGFDFSSLTLNAEQQVVATSLLFAGSDSGVWPRGLWPHASRLSYPIQVGTPANPRFIGPYQVTNMATAVPVIGTNCHELGHLLMHYPDFYDTDADDGDSEGVGEHSLMGTSNYLNGGKTPGPIDLYLKDYSGWATITDVTTLQSMDVKALSTGNAGFRLRNPAAATEYYLLENRGTGDKWAAYAPDKGLLIWHVDEAVTTDNQRQQMTPARHYELSLVQADARFDLEKNVNRGDATDLYDLTTGLFNNNTAPAANWWSGEASGLSVAVLSAAGASMNVRFGAAVTGNQLYLNPPFVDVGTDGGTLNFQVTATVAWAWSKNVTWITSSETTNQTGNQAFTYVVAPNATTASRTGTITVTGGGITRTVPLTQRSVVGDDHGNSIAAATVVALPSTTNGNIEEAGDNDYFRVNVAASGYLALESTGLTDFYGHLLNSAGGEIAHDDDSGEQANFRLSAPVTAGVYYVRVRHYNAALTGSYALVVSFAATPTLTISLATKAVAQGGENPSLTVTSNTLWSWSANVPWLASNEEAQQIGTQTFTYIVEPNSTFASRTGIITLTAAGVTRTHIVTQAAAAADDAGNNLAIAKVIAPTSTTNGRIESAGDADFFSLDVTSKGTLILQTTGTTDTQGLLMDAAGGPLAADDDTGADANFQLTMTVVPGRYYLRVTHFSFLSVGSYVLVSSFTAAPFVGLPAAGQAIAPTAANYNLTLSSNTTWSWISNSPWLTGIEAVNQSGNQTFTMAVSANTTGLNRVGQLTFTHSGGTTTYSVTQLAVGKPDLADPGTASGVTATLVVPGQNFGLNAAVINQGTAASGTFLMRYYLSSDPTITSADFLLGEQPIPPLASGASAAINAANLVVPGNTPLGNYYAGWIYDAAETVEESGETNNIGVLITPTITVSNKTEFILTQTLADGSISRWGDLANVRPNFLAGATLTTPTNGTSIHAFDATGVMTISPALVLPPLGRVSSTGPLSSEAGNAAWQAQRTVQLVPGRHATDDTVRLTNGAANPQTVTLSLTDDYGSDAATRVHYTSDTNNLAAANDTWFIISDQATPDAISNGPSTFVSWQTSDNVPPPRWLAAPDTGLGRWSVQFGPFLLAAGQTATITVRRELFDSAALANQNGNPISAALVAPITTQATITGNSVALDFGGLEHGIIYKVQRSFDLEAWESLGLRSDAAPSYSEILPTGHPKVFYRLQW